MKRDQKVTLLQNDVYKQGFLDLNDNNLWEFVTCDTDGNITSRADLLDLQYSWKMRMQENTFDVGWSNNFAHRVFGTGRHVSATNLHFDCAPANLRTALAGSNPDQKIWNAAYDEEYNGLCGLDVFTEITDKQY